MGLLNSLRRPFRTRHGDTYRQCRNCSYWVAHPDRYCANCGTGRPFLSGNSHRSLWLVFTTLLGGVLGGSVFYRSFDNTLWLYGCVAGCVTGLGWGLGLFTEVAAILQRGRRSPSLQHNELQLLQHFTEIEHALRRLTDLQRQLQREQDSGTNQFLTSVVDQADASLTQAAHRYRCELAKLELVRWRNKLEPLAHPPPGAARDHQDNYDHQARLDGLATHRALGRTLLANWSAARLDTQEAGRLVVEQLQTWLKSCDRLLEQLIASQAQRIISGAASAELIPPPTPELDRELRRVQAKESALTPDELDQVQHALDRLQAKERLDLDLRLRDQ